MVVRGGEDTQATRSSDDGAVLCRGVANGQGILGDRSFLDIVACLPTNQETVAPQDGINVCNRTFEDIEEGAGIEVGLFEVKVDLCAKLL